MAIRATYLAQGDFCLDPTPRNTRAHEIADVVPLGANMVEFQYKRICLATIDARVESQVLPQQLPMSVSILLCVSLHTNTLLRAVAFGVVGPIERPSTGHAIRSRRGSRRRTSGKVGERFDRRA